MARHCPECGAQIGNADRYCPTCGTLVDATVSISAQPLSVEQQFPAPTPTATPSRAQGAIRQDISPVGNNAAQSASPGKRIAAIMAGIAVAAAIAVALVLLHPWQASDQHQKSEPSENTSVITASTPSTETGSPSSTAEAPSSTEAPSAFDSTASIDLNNASKLQEINLFLSNFTEKGTLMNGYSYETSPDLLLADFSASHIYMNNPEEIKPGMGEPGKSWEVKNATFYLYPTVFLKRDLPAPGTLNAPAPPYVSFEGYVNLDPDRVPTSPRGIAFANGSHDAGNGRTEVTFEIYYGGPYEVTDESFYAQSLEELKARLGVSEPIATGTAVIEPCDDGTVAPFKLWTYNSTR